MHLSGKLKLLSVTLDQFAPTWPIDYSGQSACLTKAKLSSHSPTVMTVTAPKMTPLATSNCTDTFRFDYFSSNVFFSDCDCK